MVVKKWSKSFIFKRKDGKMKILKITTLWIMAIMLVTCFASTNGMAKESKKYKMTTEMPAGITAGRG